MQSTNAPERETAIANPTCSLSFLLGVRVPLTRQCDAIRRSSSPNSLFPAALSVLVSPPGVVFGALRPPCLSGGVADRIRAWTVARVRGRVRGRAAVRGAGPVPIRGCAVQMQRQTKAIEPLRSELPNHDDRWPQIEGHGLFSHPPASRGTCEKLRLNCSPSGFATIKGRTNIPSGASTVQYHCKHASLATLLLTRREGIQRPPSEPHPHRASPQFVSASNADVPFQERTRQTCLTQQARRMLSCRPACLFHVLPYAVTRILAYPARSSTFAFHLSLAVSSSQAEGSPSSRRTRRTGQQQPPR